MIELIELKDKEREKQLEKKLEEYVERLSEALNDTSLTKSRKIISAFCKAYLLRHLLLTKKVEPEGALRTLNAQIETFYRNAAKVISDYVETGGENVSGGTGLSSAD